MTGRTTPVGPVRFAVRVQPRASRDEIAGAYGDAIRIRVTAPPVDGAANDAVIALLATALGVAPRAIRIVSGSTSRTKTVEIDGVSEAAIGRLRDG